MPKRSTLGKPLLSMGILPIFVIAVLNTNVIANNSMWMDPKD